MSGNPYLDLDDEGELDEWDDEEDWYYRDGVRYRDDESPGETMARLAAEIKAGRATAPPGWKLDRPSPEMLVWTTTSGRRYAYTLTGDPLPLP